ncbi:MAG: hypothetical protein ABIQ95_16915 [Bdellovibrionia bacterium]
MSTKRFAVRIYLGTLMLFVTAFAFAQIPTATDRYRMIEVERHTLQSTLNEEARKGWQVQSITPWSKCIFATPDGRNHETRECLIVILEKK